MRIDQALREAVIRLGGPEDREAVSSARILLSHVLEVDRAALVALGDREISPTKRQLFTTLVEKALHTPVYRIIGAREFHGFSLKLNDATLEPRDDTEALIDLVMEMIGTRRGEVLRFADLGTGTGAVALALLCELPKASAIATDIAPDALSIADLNAENLGFSSRFETVSSRSESWADCLEGRFDFIVSNPPYIASAEIEELHSQVRLHDPRAALDGGVDGLDAYRAILGQAGDKLKPGGFLAIEIGFNQKQAVTDLAIGLSWKPGGFRQDLGGNDRALGFFK